MKKDSIFTKTKVKGYLIKSKYLPRTNKKNPRAKVYLKRDNNTTWSKTIEWDSDLDAVDNYYLACIGLIREWPFNEHNKDMEVLAIGYENNNYYFIVQSKVF
tara:strand:+ start:457 stop:762 length:306 start_codon:yes stop_codon:yes gene_type:complete